jgi:CubicO group peptidase (beta-lactamase class C family)
MKNNILSTPRTSRRSILGLLGAAPLAGSGMLAACGSADSEATADTIAASSVDVVSPKGLLSHGAYERFVAQRAAEDKFSGIAFLAHRGQPIWTRCYGMANRERSVANGPGTAFNLASITKCLTGVAVAQLAQQGKLAFHDTLGTYLDGFPVEMANSVTVHQLLTHTSGVGRPSVGTGPSPGESGWDSVEEVWDGTMALIRDTPLRFTPGTQYGYSNDGYFVLGAIVAQVSGQSYYDYVREHIFAAAGMTSSEFYTRPQVLADKGGIARPYASQRDGGRVDFATTPYFRFIGGPAEGAYVTASDLLRFARALSNGSLLSSAYVELITSGKTALSPSEKPNLSAEALFYGYAFLDTIVNDRRVCSHSGSGPGMANNLDIFHSSDWVSVVLSNYDTTVEPIVELGRQLLTR